MSIERIVDKVNFNNFGVLFHDTKTIEKFQRLSGMAGAYSTEYQHHYINLVGRVGGDGQRLDFAIPMALYNYHQEVSGASVEFNLEEVSKANDIAMVKAIEKFNEFETTDMYKAIVAYGVTDWQLVGLNSIHAHPAGVNRFSGTDLRADIKHPGVNFPLSIGENIPNFASIIQHKELYAEIIHTEYRIFNGVANGERIYEKGRCLTINRGITAEPAVEFMELLPGPIDEIFGTKRPQPPKPAPKKERKDYTLQDGFAVCDEEKLKLFISEMMSIWKTCEFEPDVSNVLKTNVLKGRGRLQSTTTTWHGNGGWGHGKKSRSVNQINQNLFGDEWEEDDKPAPSRKVMENYIVEAGFEKMRASRMDYHVLKATYENEQKKDLEEEQEKEPTFVEAVAYLVKKRYSEKDLRSDYSYQEMIELYWQEKLDEIEEEQEAIDELREIREQEDSFFTKDEMRRMIVSDNIMSMEKVMMIDDKDLNRIFKEIYQI